MPPTKCFIVWRKPQISEDVSFSMVEYAWASFDQTAIPTWSTLDNKLTITHQGINGDYRPSLSGEVS